MATAEGEVAVAARREPVREPTSGREYYIKHRGSWYKGKSTQGFMFTNVKRRVGNDWVNEDGIRDFGEGGSFYELPPRKDPSGVSGEHTASPETGGKRRRNKKTRKGTRKSRRTTRRKRFT